MNQHQAYSQNRDSENRIILTDLIYYILRRWRTILLGAIAVCTLFFCFKLMKGFNSLESQSFSTAQETYERSYEEYMIVKTQLENQIDELTHAIQEKFDYQHQSILMNLDSNTAFKSTSTYVVSDVVDTGALSANAETEQVLDRKINSILGSYASIIQGDTIFKDLQHEIGTKIDNKYLTELVYVQVDYQSKLLHITAFGNDKAQAQAISDAIEKEIQDASSRISIAIGTHRLECISSHIGNDVDTGILIGSIPEEGKNENGNYQTSIKSLQKNVSDGLTDLRKQLKDCNDQLSELKEPTEPEEITRDMIFKAAMKFGVLGIIVGTFLLSYYYVLQYLAGGKLIVPDEMQDNYGILVLANYMAPLCSQQNAIDKLINRAWGIHENRLCLNEVYTMAISNVMVRIKQTENEKILFVGNASTEVFDTTVSEMTRRLNDAGIEAIAAGNINEDGDAIQMLQAAEKIVLIEQAGVSRKKEIKKELQTMRDLNKEILGTIVL